MLIEKNLVWQTLFLIVIVDKEGNEEKKEEGILRIDYISCIGIIEESIFNVYREVLKGIISVSSSFSKPAKERERSKIDRLIF